ncbi:MAG: polymer-forming cytoskeletal protein [Hyphomicrobiaceae bacterium]|nr:polymer-forming cytoskeletal protein [Hyphomicrobiaceae bacterium]
MISSQVKTNIFNNDDVSPAEQLDVRQPLIELEASGAGQGSVIGADLAILGENIKIVSQETLQIDGEIHGDVSGKKVNIGPAGFVVGTVSGETVNIDGAVHGTVRAMDVLLNMDAKVDGDLIHNSLVIVEGAEFEGRVHRPGDMNELIPNLEMCSVPKAPAHVARKPAASPASSPTRKAVTPPPVPV